MEIAVLLMLVREEREIMPTLIACILVATSTELCIAGE